MTVLAATAAAATLIIAWRRAWLTPTGLLAAGIVGVAVWVGGGSEALLLLLLFFVSASVLTRSLRGRQRPGGDHAGRGRNAPQVLANGTAAAAAALLEMAGLLPGAEYAIVGAVASAMADTWATEIGTAAAGSTRLITTGARVAPGRSGGVSWFGTAAALGAASILGAAAALLTPAVSLVGWLLVTIPAGAGGMLIDSLLGATLEPRVRWFDNQTINLVGSACGAAVAWTIARTVGLPW